MTKLKLLLSAATLAGAAALAGQASANPISLGYSLDGGKTIVTLASNASDTSMGTVSTSSRAGSFTIAMNATGQPDDVAPAFSSNTLTISSTAAGSIILYASQTGTSPVPPKFTIGFSNNPQSTQSVTEAFYVSNSNAIYATTNLVASEALNPGMTISDIGTYAGLTSPYTITETYAINFTAAGRVNATIIETAAVPEPVSLSLLGAGLAGLGLVRARRKS